MYNKNMKIVSLTKVDSTHKYLKEFILENKYTQAICFFTNNQTAGIGSRGNSWVGKEGNLFFSFALSKNDLPSDLQIQSASIYFSFILKQLLNKFGSKVWLKWPNDFYLEDKKIGGTITTVSKDLIYCGIGLNLIKTSDEYGVLDIKIDSKNFLEDYFFSLEKKILWKEIFSDFKVEFQLSKKFNTTIDDVKASLENAILNNDGSIQVNNKKVFSLR